MARARLENPSDDLQQGALPRPVLAHHTEGLAAPDFEADVAQGPEIFVPLDAPRREQLLQAVARRVVYRVAFGDILKLDGTHIRWKDQCSVPVTFPACRPAGCPDSGPSFAPIPSPPRGRRAKPPQKPPGNRAIAQPWSAGSRQSGGRVAAGRNRSPCARPAPDSSPRGRIWQGT